MDDVKSKLDSIHKLLKKHISFVEDVEVVDVDDDDDDKGDDKDVNFISGTCFQNQIYEK